MDIFITTEEPKQTSYCISCHKELYPPFLKWIENTSYSEPPYEEWYCKECSRDDEAWNEYYNSDDRLE